MTLKARIRTARIRAGLSQAELAEKLGVGRTAVVHWESATSGKRPSSERLEGLALATGVPWEWLATGRSKVAPVAGKLAVEGGKAVDPMERRLLRAFRRSDSDSRQAILTLIGAGSPERG